MMKKIFLLMLLVAGVGTIALQAQETPDRAFKKAKRSLGSYNLDPRSNAEKLAEAWEMIEIALTGTAEKGDPEVWILKGQIAIEKANRDLLAATLNPDFVPENPTVIASGFEAFRQGLQISEKRYHRRDALKGIHDCVSLLNIMAVAGYQQEDMAMAHKGFRYVVEAHEILVADEQKSPLEEGAYLDAKFSAAATCGEWSDPATCLRFLNELKDANYDNPFIYDLLYNAYRESDKDKAVRYLEEGRRKHPDATSLLFTEINHYLQEGKLDQLVDKLKQAIEVEPTNKSLYLTLGNVYDNLFQRGQGDEATAQESAKYFDLAKSYYEKALELDPNYTDAIYSLGALYYNRAALYTQQLNLLADDYSKEGLRKYDELKKKVDGEFDMALPYFQRVEKLAPNDLNALIALREIYARKNEIDMSTEFKKRLDKVQAGGVNESSYFK
jgi:tetratricopeptide (TPR) repeat protein